MKERDDAVSPVIGVMLMIVVTLIIAAVVSAMAGGVFTAQSPAPTISANTEYSLSKGLSIDVLSTSEVINTTDLKIQLDSLVNDQRLSSTITEKFPQGVTGTGAGITYTNTEAPLFGKFALKSGVKMSSTDIEFRSSNVQVYDVSGTNPLPPESYSDPHAPDQTPPDVTTWGGGKTAQELSHTKLHRLDAEHPMYYYMIKLNEGWTWQKSEKTFTYSPPGGTDDSVKVGDKVSVKIIYVPNGQTVYSSDVKVVS